MSKAYFLLLAAAPLIAVAAAGWHALSSEGREEPANHARVPLRACPAVQLVWLGKPTVAPGARDVPTEIPTYDSARALATACRETARRIARDLGPECRTLARPPLVLAGDLSEAELQRWFRETIEPAARAMAAEYFATAPDEPITILAFADEDSYRRHAKRLFGHEHVPRCGYYRPHLRTVLINASTGRATLLHELTHALMAFDFPDAPDWLGEGLASLHEQADFRPDGQGLIGQSGPRLATLQKAIAAGRLGPLRSLLTTDDFHGPQEKLNYAQARYFCLYVQRHGVLGECYRRIRMGAAAGLSSSAASTVGQANRGTQRGEQAVLTLFPGRTWAELDADLRQFARMGLQPADMPPTAHLSYFAAGAKR